MVKLIVLSDTHLHAKVPDEILDRIKDADIVVHAGDFVTKEVYESLKKGCKKLVAVHGNSDSDELKTLLPESEIFEAGGMKVGVVHMGRYGADTTNMRYLALEMGVNVLVFGHLHRPIIDKSDVLLICPGSPTSPRMSDPAMVSLDIDGSNVKVDIIKMSTGNPCDYINFARSL